MKLGDLRDLLPEYPRFAPMSIELIEPLRTAVAAFEPYSDWNALSLWCWGETARLSRLGENLILELPAYTGGDPVISILGDDNITSVATTLLNSGIQELALIPEPIAQACMRDAGLVVTEDHDNHDYILDATLIADGVTNRRREQIRQFERNLSGAMECRELAVALASDRDAVCVMFDHWASIRNRSDNDVAPERLALTRLFELAFTEQDRCYATGVCIEGELRSFCITELHDPPWLTAHFSKADTTIKGLGVYTETAHFAALLAKQARERERENYSRINVMQDLGVQGLREHKKGLHPVTRLNKYRVHSSTVSISCRTSE